jgi:endoglucanase
MKKLLIIFLFAFYTLTAQTRFTRGVNLTGWFQVSSAQQIQFRKYTRQDFENIKSLGCDVVRLPVNLHYMTSGSPDYTLDPLFLEFLNPVIDWAEELGIHLILDNHTFDVSADTPDNIDQVLIPVWKQMAEEFKDRSSLIYYEILNEPHGISDERWNEIQLQVINEIRKIDSVHTIIVGPAGWNSYNNLKYMPVYEDDNLMYTFHFYDPFIFTHQGAGWTDPSLVPLSGVPFPYSESAMPDFPPELNGKWIESSFNNYQYEGTISKVRELLDIAAGFSRERNADVFCGEFGVYMKNSSANDRILWYSVVRTYLEYLGISWTIWDYHGGFGIYEKGSNGLFGHDLNVPLVRSLGFTVPPQTEFEIRPDSSEINIYDDYYGVHIYESSNAGDGVINYYYPSDPAEGNYCILFTGSGQYSVVGFNFSPDRDLSYLFDSGYWMSMKVKGGIPGSMIDIRFVDTKTSDPDDHPWRMRYIIDESVVQWDNEWHELNIPLSSFEEHGSWDDGWYEPIGEFDWSRIDMFEIVAEHHDLIGRKFFFDAIKINDPNATRVDNKIVIDDFRLEQNYPNPFNPVTTIEYNLPVMERSSPSNGGQVISFNSREHSGESLYRTVLKVYDILGREVATLVNRQQSPGYHRVVWDASALANGIYIIRLSVHNKVFTRKAVLIK